MPLLQFLQLSSSIDPAFWHALTSLKIDVLKLSDSAVPVRGWYERGRWVKDRETGQDVGVGGEVRLDGRAFEEQGTALAPGRVAIRGLLKNFNTIEEFKNSDKQALFNSFTDDYWASNGEDAAPAFLLIAFADLKKYKYYYWFAFPAFVAKPGWELGASGWRGLSENDFRELRGKLPACEGGVRKGGWLGKNTEKGWEVAEIKEWSTFFSGVPGNERHLIFIDPSAHSEAPGWPLRSLLAFASKLHGSDASQLRIIAWRDAIGSSTGAVEAASRSLLGEAHLPAQEVKPDGAKPGAVGWEKNAAGKLAPRLADLGPMMDPARLADQAVDLNLKLMRWRILPGLQLEKIAATRCLLLGAGTLGCYVSRTLMAWGVRKITFLDSAGVSFSNPVRQPLFEFSDCLGGGKPKAECAAAALRRIYPGVDAKGIELSIPMPGHPVSPHLVKKTKADVKTLEDLFDAHDVIYLLMDSRESRWLPTVIGAAKRKLVMNAALGFDSYLVMRHGVSPTTSSASRPTGNSPSTGASVVEGKLGCYFCNDVVAPADSLTDRTLDQMCTVTRPGLAAIASATAVELMTSVLQHPEGIEAPSDTVIVTKETTKGQQPLAEPESVLGQVPHQIRGYLARFESMKLVGPAYDKCTGCSDRVVEAYLRDGFDMLLNAFNDGKYLEQLTGLDKLYGESEALMETVDWDEDDDAASA